MIWYFAYGSNMDHELLKTRIGDFSQKVSMYIDNHKLLFNKKSMIKGIGYANIIPFPDSKVYGIGYLISETQIQEMDDYEGVDSGHYKRISINCNVLSSEITQECQVYIACNDKTSENLIPTKQYLSYLLSAIINFPVDYQNYLKEYTKVAVTIEEHKHKLLREYNTITSIDYE
jgi:hypothetical protein